MKKPMKKAHATILEELHVRLEASILANDGVLWPLSQAIPPTDEQLEEVRKRRHAKQNGKEEA